MNGSKSDINTSRKNKTFDKLIPRITKGIKIIKVIGGLKTLKLNFSFKKIRSLSRNISAEKGEYGFNPVKKCFVAFQYKRKSNNC